MAIPADRYKLLPLRGVKANLDAGVEDILDGEICYATDEDQYYQKEGSVLVSVGSTKAQGALADSSIQPGDGVSSLTNDAGYITLAEVPGDLVTSVNGKVGDVVLGKSDVGLNDVDNTSDADKPISTATQAALDDKADLVDGVIPNSQLPSIAISEYLGLAADEAAMLALNGEKGDWCVRDDLSNTWIVTGDDSSQIGSWTELATPADLVSSVNGYQGAVVLSAADVGAIPVTDAPNFAPSSVDLQSVTSNGNTTTTGASFGGALTVNENINGLKAISGAGEASQPVLRVYSDTLEKYTTNLNADGSASFAGNIQATEPRSSTAGSNTGGLSINPSDTTHYYNFRVDSVANNALVVDTLSGASKISFGADGSASFASTTTIGGGALNGVEDGVQLFPTGGIHATQASGSSTILSGYVEGSSTKNVAITAEGSASFAGSVQSGGNTFGGSPQPGVILNHEGAVVVARGTSSVFIGKDTADGSTTSEITHDGSASFVGGVDSEAYFRVESTNNDVAPFRATDSNGNTVFDVTGTGQGTFGGDLRVQDGGNFRVRIANNATQDAILLQNNGNASFAGTISASGQNTINEASALKFSQETNVKSQIRAYGPDASTTGSLEFKVSPTSGAALTPLTLNSDGSASFSGTVSIPSSSNEALRIGRAGVGYKGGWDASGNLYLGNNLFAAAEDKTVEINNDGSASFSGAIKVDRAASGNTVIYGQLAGTTTSEITADGTATFAGGDSRINSSGRVQTNSYFESYRTESGGAVLIGGVGTWDSQLSANVSILANGNATFAGSIRSTRFTSNAALGSNVNGTDYPFAVYDGSSNLYASISETGAASFAGGITAEDNIAVSRTLGTSACYVGQLNGSDTSSINADGSAEFSGNLQAADTKVRLVTSSNHGLVRVLNSSLVDTIFLEGADGSAGFQGDIQSGGDAGDSSRPVGTKIWSVGSLSVAAVSGQNIWNGYTAGTNTNTSSITSDGEASFSGQVDCSSDGNNVASLVSNGYFQSERTAGTASVFAGQLNGSLTTSILADGSASFAGNVSTDSYYTVDRDVTPGTGALYLGFTQGVQKFKVGTDGAASFAEAVSTTAIKADYNLQTGNRSEGLGLFIGTTDQGNATTANSTASITGDGSAEFSGSVSVKDGIGVWKAANNTCTSLQTSGTNSNTAFISGKSGVTSLGSAGTTKFMVFADGSATFSGAITAQGSVLTSDAKFKTNIKPAGSQLSDVVQLGNLLKNWDWKEDAPVSDKDSRFLGLIAQEAEEVSPGIVTDVGRGESAYKGIKHDVLVMKLLGAVAELTAEVVELRAQIKS